MGTTELKSSGLPLFLDDAGKMTVGEGIQMEGSGHKEAAAMLGLLADEEGLDPTEWAYDTYRKLVEPADAGLFASRKMCYDITVIAPGTFNGECKKTSGHYHGWNPEHTNTYGEVYEVLSGTALFVLQKSPDFEENPEGAHIEDVILVKVPAGQTLLVPPNYGHCSVNIGDGPLVFSNVAYTPCPVIYDSVKAHHGMAYYIFKDADGNLDVRLNPTYVGIDVPEPKFATVHDDPTLGIDFTRGAYRNFVENPDAFDHLPHPDAYIEQIMGLLDYE